jgi:hypothetical protein
MDKRRDVLDWKLHERASKSNHDGSSSSHHEGSQGTAIVSPLPRRDIHTNPPWVSPISKTVKTIGMLHDCVCVCVCDCAYLYLLHVTVCLLLHVLHSFALSTNDTVRYLIDSSSRLFRFLSLSPYHDRRR